MQPLGKSGLVKESEAMKDYLAIDIRSHCFPDNDLSELAKTYMNVFNEVKDVSVKWSARSANNMIDLHARTLGCNVALLDLKTDRVVGGFLSTIVPSAEGWRLSSQDLFIDSKHRGNGVGSSFYHRALAYADEICKRELRSDIAVISGTTYKIPSQPKKMWKKKGYELQPLFSLAAQSILRSDKGIGADIIIEQVRPDDADKVAAFITSNKTVSSDKEKWGEPQASAYVNFMLHNHPATFVAGKMGNKIVAVSSINLLPGRSGPYGIEAQCFVTKTSLSRQQEIVGATFKTLLMCANGASMQLFGDNIAAIEVTASGAPFFRKMFSKIEEDKEFLGIRGFPSVLKNNLSQSKKYSQVTLVESHSRTTRVARPS